MAPIRRQRQSVLPLISDLNELQHAAVGDDPLPVLPVIKFMHGVKLETIEAVHGVFICPFTDTDEIATADANTAMNWKTLKNFMTSCCKCES